MLFAFGPPKSEILSYTALTCCDVYVTNIPTDLDVVEGNLACRQLSPRVVIRRVTHAASQQFDDRFTA